MFNKPEDARMTREEAEKYGREIDAKNARLENVEIAEEITLSTDAITPRISEAEVKRRVGEQNYENMKDDSTANSINS
ncbi:hypothetical protein MHZ95_11580 [Sporosarcina sp. ACRSM]|uniref:hypothetical protein n=1 Tax=Sporosarcina sp. ACRSM TaxID=2918216 RepID=UPI001EF68949|nr:hypothetical protein [Sporosarcina sp. ACRSM]MCG7335922.1 hypothetical protein [Sporosarcina sp. ACRSM]